MELSSNAGGIEGGGPKSWQWSALAQISTKITDGEHLTPRRAGQGYYLLSARNILDGRISLQDVDYVGLQEYLRIRRRCDPTEGDVLISCSGTIGRVAIVPPGLECVMVRSAALIRIDSASADARFVKYYLQSEPGQDQIRNSLNQGAQANLFLGPIGALRVPLPPLREQFAIAAALSDVDALLGALDQTIAKKRDLKEAAMQQLLAGQIRLPGFSAEWRDGCLGDVIGALEAGVSVNSVDDSGGTSAHDKSILKTSAVANGRFLAYECKAIAARDLLRARLNPRRETLLISRMNTPDLVGECGYVDRDYPSLFVPDRLWLTRFYPEAESCGRWLSYLLSMAAFKRRIRAVATGTSGSMKNLAKQAFLALSVRLPPAAEQNAIASVLADMDAELSALVQRRDKTRLLKQGMMQELLTGKTRLI